MINTEVRRSQTYVGTGEVSSYTFPFRVFGMDQITVLVRPEDGEAAELPKSAYSVSLASTSQQSTGGTVTLNEPLAEGSKLVILSSIPYTQLLALQNQGAFSPSDLNAAWDKNCALIQQVKDQLDRAVLTPELGDKTPEEFTESLFVARDKAVASASAAAASAGKAAASAAEAASFATSAARSAAEAEASKNAINVTKDEVTAEGRKQIAAIQTEGSAQVGAVTNAGASAVANVVAAGNSAVRAVTDTANSSVGAVRGAASEAVATVQAEGAKQVTVVDNAGASQVADVNSAGSAQIRAVESAGAAQIAEIQSQIVPHAQAAKSAAEAAKTSAAAADTSKTQAEAAATRAEEAAATAGYGFRYSAGISANGTAALTTLAPATNARVGDHVVNSSGAVFSITALTSSSFTVGASVASIKGATGATGATGPRGPQGERGETGATGPQGPRGVQGETGPRGPKGNTGEPLKLLGTFGTLAELQAAHPTGEYGQAYMVADHLYTWTGDAWTDMGSLKGPKGDIGAAGAAGPQGPQGLQGAPGEAGPQGPQGLSAYQVWLAQEGNTGKTEADYFAAIKGDKGDKGETGATGPAGPAGPQGETGATGPQGPQGEKGDKGNKGDKGDPGAAGPRGPQGDKGDPGPAGAPGTAQINDAAVATTTSWSSSKTNTAIGERIPKSGNAGTLTTTETISAASTVGDSSPRSMTLANGGSLAVNNGSANNAWITVVALQGSAKITLGSNWSWSGSAPTLAKGLVTLAWYGRFGVANFQKFGA